MNPISQQSIDEDFRIQLQDFGLRYDPVTGLPNQSFFRSELRSMLAHASAANLHVALVWIDLTKESYGIHGTPEPDRIGKSYSHGCIRLTNWDALDLAKRVRKGTPIDFLDEPSPLPTGAGEARGRE